MSDWQDEGLCARGDIPPDMFDLEKPDGTGGIVKATPYEINTAKALCAMCPTRRQCALQALALEAERKPLDGVIWAGVCMYKLANYTSATRSRAHMLAELRAIAVGEAGPALAA